MTRKAIYLGSALTLAVGLGLAGAAQADWGDGPRGPGFDTMLESFDVNGDGSVTRAEIDTVLAQRFEEADTDGDGVLSADEAFAAAEARRAEREEMRRRARSDAMAARLDANDDGVLSADEIAARSGPQRMFDRLDANDDGAISPDELERARQRVAEHHGRGAWGWHRHGDRNGPYRGPRMHDRPWGKAPLPAPGPNAD